MRVKMDYTMRVIDRASGRTYWYFRKGGRVEPLPGAPGTDEFGARYRELLAAQAPRIAAKLRRRDGAQVGTLSWIIARYTAPDALPWSTNSESTRYKYRLRFDWLEKKFGDELLADFDRDLVKRIKLQVRDEHSPGIANEIIDRIGQLWRWADENCDLRGEAKLDRDPTENVKRFETESESALIWPPELHTAWERYADHVNMRRFYFLLRYTGQRRGDVLAMETAHFDRKRNMIFVMQEKTGTRIWVACHKALRAFLDGEDLSGKYLIPSPRGGGMLNGSMASTRLSLICGELGFAGYSPHGLRHSAAVTMLEAGCTIDEVMAITGHKDRKQLEVYLKQVNQRRLGRNAMDKWEKADDEAARADAIAAAENVVALKKGRRS